jgi:hypothetical protein
MNQPITYSLRNHQPRSDDYYRDIAAFTDEVVAYTEGSLGALVSDMQAHAENSRTRLEYLYELLVLGVLWSVYANRALGLSRSSQRMLHFLGRRRKRFPAVQPAIDALRGIMATVFLGHSSQILPDDPPTLTRDHMGRLIDWLSATGDFDPEVDRLRVWLAFFAELPSETIQGYLMAIMTCADWFADRSLQALGNYTPRVEAFLAQTHPHYRWREDIIFCGRERVEYHLCMVGTEMMNRAFRETFLATQQKVVLLPPCMRARPADQCQAKQKPFGAQCLACEPQCHVHQVTKLGQKHGFAVFMLPDDLASLSPGADTRTVLANLGIVGVSCPLTNPQGGWKTRALGIPAQGLLLDYCGCSWHWHLGGRTPTDINLRQLLRLIKSPDEKPHSIDSLNRSQMSDAEQIELEKA